MSRALSFAAALILAACATATPPGTTATTATASDPFPTRGDQRSRELFVSYLLGTFESIPQVTTAGGGDSSRVTLRVVPVWTERAGETWLYQEYSIRGQEGGPYLQRLFRVGDTGDGVLLAEYTLPGDGSRYFGAWQDPKSAFAFLDPKSLREIPNCRMTVADQSTIVFAGGTIGKACRAHVPEGAYEVSSLSLSSATLRIWDRGYDAAGKVVWGSAIGPLEMRRMSSRAQ
ncbi:Chromophore lyase CpcT/CpeT [Usitatibacter rugosus]|uniref:Chromophore lyase CpcT/CpeT n=1 Tax=Usitatibacter rugosus TaxID=2732067 RepID=A0A6M4GYN1_9PROT|nr:chromophore lyase CpcT/CpeT [Usitatibacter rugosus]QJR10637.1 Chromophore lyase CpcT/CpeT [Usitatibacter rugosus]